VEYLEEVLGRFTEGFDTADLREAQALCRQKSGTGYAETKNG
jgi:hypothetical protein